MNNNLNKIYKYELVSLKCYYMYCLQSIVSYIRLMTKLNRIFYYIYGHGDIEID